MGKRLAPIGGGARGGRVPARHGAEGPGQQAIPPFPGGGVEGAVELVPGDGLDFREEKEVRGRRRAQPTPAPLSRARKLSSHTFGLMTMQSVGSPMSVNARARTRQMAVLPAPGGPRRKTDQRTVKMSRSWET